MQQNCDNRSILFNFGGNYVNLDSRLIFLKYFSYADIKFRFITLHFHYLTQNKQSVRIFGLKTFQVYVNGSEEIVGDIK